MLRRGDPVKFPFSKFQQRRKIQHISAIIVKAEKLKKIENIFTISTRLSRSFYP